MQAAEELSIEGGDCRVPSADAVRIAETWTSALREQEPPAPPVPPPPPKAPRAGPALAGADPEWRVPLRREWEGILIHHSATDSGSLAKFDKHHREVNGWLMVGYDFIIGNGDGSGDGVIETSDRWRRQIQGAHAGAGLKRYNEHWIGICLVGDFNAQRPSPRQIASLRRLVAFLRAYCDIPAANVRGHRDVRDTDCPGRFFPSDEASVVGPRAK
jgi:N-acetylmuramoyl-L-alanine amidase